MEKRRRFLFKEAILRTTVTTLLFLSAYFAGGQDTTRLVLTGGLIPVPDTVIIIRPGSGSIPEAVLFLLADKDWDSGDWPGQALLSAVADTLGWAIVCPGTGGNSWYIDSPADSSSEYPVYFKGALFPATMQALELSSGQVPVYITGYGMGGFGALSLFLSYPGLFEGAGAISPVFGITEFSTDPVNMRRLLGDGFGNTFLRTSFSLRAQLGAVANTTKIVHIVHSEESSQGTGWEEFRQGCDDWNIPLSFDFPAPSGDFVRSALGLQISAFLR